MQYERSITSGLEVIAKVKVFVHATDVDADADADANADGRAMTLAPRTYLSRLAKKKCVGQSEDTYLVQITQCALRRHPRLQ